LLSFFGRDQIVLVTKGLSRTVNCIVIQFQLQFLRAFFRFHAAQKFLPGRLQFASKERRLDRIARFVILATANAYDNIVMRN
jgi:hypothetical protein